MLCSLLYTSTIQPNTTEITEFIRFKRLNKMKKKKWKAMTTVKVCKTILKWELQLKGR